MIVVIVVGSVIGGYIDSNKNDRLDGIPQDDTDDPSIDLETDERDYTNEVAEAKTNLHFNLYDEFFEEERRENVLTERWSIHIWKQWQDCMIQLRIKMT